MPGRHERLRGGGPSQGHTAPSGKLKPGPGHSAGEVASHQLGRIRSAMIELTAERGYDAVTIRELTQRAGVSSRSFYKHYAGKEDCFLEAHRWVAQKELCKLDESLSEAHDAKGAIGRVVARIAYDWGTAPQEAYVLLLSPYRAGDRSRDQLRHVEQLFKSRMERSVAGAGFGSAVSTLIGRSIIDGLASIARSRLVSGNALDLARDANDLAEWVSAYVDPSIVRLVPRENDRCPHRDGYVASAADPVYPAGIGEITNANSDLVLLLSGATKLASRSYRTSTLTPDAIATAAGVSRKRFFASFPDVESCLTAAVSLKIAETLRRIRYESQDEGTSTICLARTVNSLCRQLAWEPSLSDVYLGDAFAGMVSARLRVQGFLAVELNALMAEAIPGIALRKSVTEASVGALWGGLRHLRGSRGVSNAPQLTDYLTYLILAPAIGASSAFDVMQREREAFAA